MSKKNTSRSEEEELEQAFRRITGDSAPAAKSSTPQKKKSSGGKYAKASSGGKYAKASSADSIRRNRMIAIIAVCCAAVVLLIGIGVTVFYGLTGGPDDGKILDNVSAAGIRLGGMTPEEATAALERAVAKTFEEESMVITLAENTLELSPKDTGAKLDVASLVADAYALGRTGGFWEMREARQQIEKNGYIIALLPYLDLDTDYIRQALDAYAMAFNSVLTQPEIKLESEIPPLDAENADPDYQGKLLITVGTPGRDLNFDTLYNEIIDAYSMSIFAISKDAPVTEPESVDLEEIYKQFCTEPVDAVMDMKTFAVTPETYGYTFDITAAEELLKKAEAGETVEIPMTMVAPAVLSKDLEATLFRDVLAEATTYQYSGYNRSTNLRLACEAVDGTIVYPGEVFSYNDTLGERTPEKGYLPAGSYMNDEIVDTYGGGICQVSSTLYYCALYADLDIVERWYHTYTADYLPLGMDATVNWGTLDFRFGNNTNYPIRIDAEYDDGEVSITLMGTDEKDYYVVMDYKVIEELVPKVITQTMTADNPKGYADGDIIQYPMDGYIVETYKYRYDKETGELLSDEYEDISRYSKRDKIVCKIDKPTEPPTEEPTTEPTQSPQQGPVGSVETP